MSNLPRHLAALGRPRVLYTDVDGTLLGPGGSLLTGPDGQPSIRAAQALVDASAEGLAVVLVSGRGRIQLSTDARLLGLDGCIAEAGGVIVRGEEIWFEWGEAPQDIASTPHDALDRAGAVRLLLDRFHGDLRHYEPWCHGREGGHLLHGLVDVGEANRLLVEEGLPWAYLMDNGATGGWAGRNVRAYHLLPRGVGKAQAVDDDLRARGVRADEAAAIGDSLADMAMAGVVGTYIQVANGHGELGGNRFRVEGHMGDGFAEAVAQILSAAPPSAAEARSESASMWFPGHHT
jgi:phosphoglycolate phosphatase